MTETVEKVQKTELNEKKMFRTIFWRQFQLLGCMSHTRMQGIGYGWTLAPVLKEIYPDRDKYLESLKRESMFFNTTQALAPFIMGLTISMEKENAENPDFDVNTINGVKVGLMGPFAGNRIYIFLCYPPCYYYFPSNWPSFKREYYGSYLICIALQYSQLSDSLFRLCLWISPGQYIYHRSSQNRIA